MHSFPEVLAEATSQSRWTTYQCLNETFDDKRISSSLSIGDVENVRQKLLSNRLFMGYSTTPHCPNVNNTHTYLDIVEQQTILQTICWIRFVYISYRQPCLMVIRYHQNIGERISTMYIQTICWKNDFFRWDIFRSLSMWNFRQAARDALWNMFLGRHEEHRRGGDLDFEAQI